MARSNIDIGGPCMVRASAKNYLRVASVTDPADYDGIVAELERTNGVMSFERRLNLARKAFAHTAAYDKAIADYLKGRTLDEVRKCYRFEK
jgi:phosphoribosylaminoimidazolecarboxamide formyltransferase/IMP cyclohydrolase